MRNYKFFDKNSFVDKMKNFDYNLDNVDYEYLKNDMINVIGENFYEINEKDSKMNNDKETIIQEIIKELEKLEIDELQDLLDDLENDKLVYKFEDDFVFDKNENVKTVKFRRIKNE